MTKWDGLLLLIAGVALAFSIRAWYAYDRNNWAFIECRQVSDITIGGPSDGVAQKSQ